MKKLYRTDGDEDEDMGEVDRADGLSYKTTTQFRRNELTDVEGDVRDSRGGLKKNHSTSNLRNSTSRLSEG